MTRRLRAAALAALLAAASCSSGGADDGAVADKTTTSESTTTTERTGTNEQFASAVAEIRDDLLETLHEVEPCLVGPDSECDALAVMAFFTLRLESELLALGLTKLFKESSTAYIGAVPDELKGLVDRTVTAGYDLKAAEERFSDQSCASLPDVMATPGPDCMDLTFDLYFAVSEMEQVLAAWSPYI